MVETFCAIQDVKDKAGKNMSSSVTDAMITNWINSAEAHMNVAMREDMVADFSLFKANVMLLLEEACSSRAAVHAIAYDSLAYTNQAEAQFLVNLNWAVYRDAMIELNETEKIDWMREQTV